MGLLVCGLKRLFLNQQDELKRSEDHKSQQDFQLNFIIDSVYQFQQKIPVGRV
jgi:hypothetical protein